MKRPLATTALSLLLAALAGAASAQTLLIDRIVVRVNDRIATMIDFQKMLAERRQAILADQSLPEARRQQVLDNAGRAVLTDIYEELLLLSRADQLGARVTDVDVEKALATQRERMGLETEEQMRQALLASGRTEEALHQQLRQNLPFDYRGDHPRADQKENR